MACSSAHTKSPTILLLPPHRPRRPYALRHPPATSNLDQPFVSRRRHTPARAISAAPPQPLRIHALIPAERNRSAAFAAEPLSVQRPSTPWSTHAARPCDPSVRSSKRDSSIRD